jgi:integrase
MKGEGTVYQRKDGLWCCQLSIGNGKRISKYSRRQKVVMAWRKEQLEKIRAGVDLAAGKILYGRYLVDWYAMNKHNYSRATCRLYEITINKHILPNIGQLILQETSPIQIDQFYKHLRDSGLGPSSLHIVSCIVHHSFEDARIKGLIYFNPASRATKTKVRNKERTILSVQQTKEFLRAVQGNKYELIYNLAIYTGMRISEILGLTVIDIDFNIGEVRVNHRLERPKRDDWELTNTKTNKSRRSIPVPHSLSNKIHHHIIEQELSNGDLVFTTNGYPISWAAIGRDIKSVLAAAGLPKINFHDLRHVCASLMILHGVPAKVVQERLGHSNIGITINTYQHLFPGMRENTTMQLNDLLEN